MGIYINPPDQSKESWLCTNGFEASSAQIAKSRANFKNLFPVCLVDNGLFKAAGVVDSEHEFEAFTQPNDHRPKLWFIVHIDQLTSEVIGETYANHLRKSVAEA